MKLRRLLIAAYVIAGAFGLAATVFWLRPGHAAPDTVRLAPLGLGFALVAALTTANLLVRWLRWHLLTRCLGLSVPTRLSVRLYAVTLPTLATPFSAGELIRVALLARHHPGRRVGRAATAVWMLERLSDVIALGFFVLVAVQAWSLVAAGLLMLGALGYLLRNRHALLEPASLVGIATSTVFAWSLPIAGLWAMFALLGEPITAAAAAYGFSKGTLCGGLTGVPMGAGVAGSAMIVHLRAAGAAASLTPIAIAAFRAATAWYAVALGALVLVLWRREISAGAPVGSRHFDELAPAYSEEIPEHVRARLLERKTSAMRDGLGDLPPQSTHGLDIGCGQGWYAEAMGSEGYDMLACDASSGQIGAARAADGVDAVVGDATALPFDAGRFDFAYSINMIHHIGDAGAQEEALREAIRVLKPGGRFFLHEINTENPLFRFYMGYVFPLVRRIDEGTERWVRPSRLPEVDGATWSTQVRYMTFIPDFVPASLMPLAARLESWLERSSLRQWSAHYIACLTKEAG